MRLIQATIAVTGTAQQISPNLNSYGQSGQVYCSVLVIQNNGSNNMRVGDNTTTATKGIIIYPAGSITTQPLILRGTMLAAWWIEGTAGDVADILYESSN